MAKHRWCARSVGVDTDRLLQEKQRGLTIDLGFAYIDNGQIGFVDVPGHQKFIHNMVAGVASNQHALMVIAADDGPMPQSKEHLDILSLVGIRSGVIALTKADRVDEQRLLEVKQDIQQMVHGTFLQDAAIVPTSIEDPSVNGTLVGEAARCVAGSPTRCSGEALSPGHRPSIHGKRRRHSGYWHSPLGPYYARRYVVPFSQRLCCACPRVFAHKTSRREPLQQAIAAR